MTGARSEASEAPSEITKGHPFGMLGIGVVFLFDITITYQQRVVDILPDFIGFTLIGFALWRLRRRTAALISGIGLATVALAATVLDLLGRTPHATGAGWTAGGEATPLGLGISLAGLLGSVYVVWHFCGAVRDFARDVEDPRLAQKADVYKALYVGYGAMVSAGSLYTAALATSQPETLADTYVLIASGMIVLFGLVSIVLLGDLAMMARQRDEAVRRADAIVPDRPLAPRVSP